MASGRFMSAAELQRGVRIQFSSRLFAAKLFYESDCQVRTSSRLIALAFSHSQSAPDFEERENPTAASAERIHAALASFISLEFHKSLDVHKRRGRAERTMVLSETRSRRSA
jgi:hypothetical protein